MSLVRAGLLLSLIMMLCSAMIPFTPAFEERISEVLMVSHHRNHGRFIGICGVSLSNKHYCVGLSLQNVIFYTLQYSD